MPDPTANPQFIPGPYEAKPENVHVPAQVWADRRQIADVFGPDRATRAATATLFASAPALYVSAAYIDYAAEGIDTPDDDEVVQISITGKGLKDLRAALSLATTLPTL